MNKETLPKSMEYPFLLVFKIAPYHLTKNQSQILLKNLISINAQHKIESTFINNLLSNFASFRSICIKSLLFKREVAMKDSTFFSSRKALSYFCGKNVEYL